MPPPFDKVQPVRPELVEYEKVRRQSPDTVAGQLKMADWCREHGLAEQRTMHLKRVLQLDPDQADVRRALGYHKVKDQWMTRDEEKADQGLVKRDGIWITPQRAEILDSQKKQLKAEADWRRKISTWRNWLDGKQAEQAKRSLRAIDDPMAITALTERLTKKREARTDARLLYVEALAHINTQMARGTLAASAIDDPLEEVRLSCLDELQRQKDDGVTDYFIGRMRDKRASNETINRAGVALGRMKNPSCVETLIDYLITGHKQVIPPPGGQGAMTTTFNKKGGPGGGLGMNQQPIVIINYLKNQDVLDALVAITGQSFGFDQRAWNTWYADQKAKGAPVAKQS